MIQNQSSANKPHIGIYGRRNAGKSSLINAISGQQIAIVSEVPGTTTDPVKKNIELTGFGPAILVDTAGIDDEGEIGNKRTDKSMQSIANVDLALLLIADTHWGQFEDLLVQEFKRYDIPFILVLSKQDTQEASDFISPEIIKKAAAHCSVSIHKSSSIENLISLIKKAIPESAYKHQSLLGDMLSYGDIVLLITPIDAEAPAGRLIMPQVQMIRDILDNECVAIVLKEREVDSFLKNTGIKPKLVITDSQLFLKADASIPKDIPLTSFSIVLARHKGEFAKYLEGTPRISALKDGDRILLLESCTHHVSCDDIGRVKIPRWLSAFTGKRLEYDVVSGLSNLNRPIEDYSLVIQCGGCTITSKQLKSRLRDAIDAEVPVTNYGMAIAYVQGIYHRAVAPFTKHTPTSESYL